MKRFGITLALTALLVVFGAQSVSARIVVLTEEPVARFQLPDGSVLKNAYVFRRGLEGLLIMHDDGSYYLNFKTLPDDWREAYRVSDEVEQVASAVDEREDPYAMYPILRRVGLSPQAVTFYKSKRYDGKVDATLLSACALKSLLDGDRTTAARLLTLRRKHFPDVEKHDVSSWFELCKECQGKGAFYFACKECAGTGMCSTCEGKGEFPSDFENADPRHCVECRGTGRCLECNGSGQRSRICLTCKGKGNQLKEKEVKLLLQLVIKQLNQYQPGSAG